VNPDYVSLLKQGLFRISDADAEDEVRVIEHSGHSLFIGTPFVP
jgi:CTP synthase (UTP-ammonia lyase)